MVDPDKLGQNVLFRHAILGRQELLKVNRRVAQTNRFHLTVLSNRLRDDPRRIREIQHPCIRCQLLDIAANVQNHRNRAQRLQHAARARRLLPDDAVFNRNMLILFTCREQADTHLGCHKIGTRNRLSAIQRQVNLDRQARLFHHAFGQIAYNLQLMLAFFNVNKP